MRSFTMNRVRTMAFAVVVAIPMFCAGHSAQADDSLYLALGGHEGIVRIVNDAFDEYVTDPRIRDQFDNISPQWLKARLVDQFCELAGGPCHYRGRDMAAAHKGLHLSVAQFNALVEDLQDAFDKQGVPNWTQNRFLALLAPMEHQVVTR